MIKYDKEKIKVSNIESISVIVFCITLLISNNYPIAIAVTLLNLLILTVSKQFLISERFRNNTLNIMFMLWFAVILLALIDTLTTYYAVFHVRIAYEYNPLVNFLWENLGVITGELIRWSIISFIFALTYKKLGSENIKQQLASSFVIVFMFLLWALVDYSNIFQIIDYSCG